MSKKQRYQKKITVYLRIVNIKNKHVFIRYFNVRLPPPTR